jgi:D-alanyl-D-alanine carboxypeptidase
MTAEHADTARGDRAFGPERVHEVLNQLVADGAPAALAELRDERGTWKLASGVAELGTERPADAEGWFRIGSVTKTFTATVILQLAGEGRLGLGGTVQRWLPGTVPGGAHITVRQLLDHTSGLYNYTRGATTDAVLRDRLRHWTPHEIVALAASREPQFRPGTSRAYNNTGYVLLGLLIERITQRPLRPGDPTTHP